MTWRVVDGDCRDVLGSLPVANAVVTCPPYYGSGLGATPAQYVRYLVTAFREVRVDGPVTLIVGDGKHRGMPWLVANALILDGWCLAQELIWAKHNGHDHIFVFHEKPLHFRTVLEVPPEPHAGTRFATLPEALLEPLIAAGTECGDLIVDPFAGSGTSGIVSTRLNRDFIGVEIEASSADWARHRITDSLTPKEKCGDTHG